MYKLNNVIKIENNKVLKFASHHSQFHYLASDCNLNIANFMIFKKNYKLLDSYIERSLFMYPENKKAIELRNGKIENDNFNYIKTEEISFNMIKSEKELYKLEKMIEFELKNKNINKIENYLLKISKIIDKIHYNYHILLADKYFELAKLYIAESLISEGKFFIGKALETEKNNPNNKKYGSYIQF